MGSTAVAAGSGETAARAGAGTTGAGGAAAGGAAVEAGAAAGGAAAGGTGAADGGRPWAATRDAAGATAGPRARRTRRGAVAPRTFSCRAATITGLPAEIAISATKVMKRSCCTLTSQLPAARPAKRARPPVSVRPANAAAVSSPASQRSSTAASGRARPR